MAPKIKRPRSPSIQTAPRTERPQTQRTKKLKLLAAHAHTSPFPDFPRPTPADAERVHALLSRAHPDLAARRAPDAANDAARTCGSVPNVLEALIGTVLSQHTSSRNAGAAQRGLDAAFGRRGFAAIASAPHADVVAAIRAGGLAQRKATVIQGVLHAVHARHGTYSLQHLVSRRAGDGESDAGKGDAVAEGARTASITVSDEDAMAELVSYDGVGPKTAACVLLFCMGRAAFPVDTHVFRLARLLGWVPPRADRVAAQAHLELKIPSELKYGLHVLMVRHGKRCKGCKGGAGAQTKGECVLKRWLREERGVKEEELEAAIVKAEEDIEGDDADGAASSKIESA